jgi:hypothetical protein
VVADKKWAFGAGILVLGVVLYFVLSPGDADRIKARFEFLADNISKTAGENKLIGAANAKRIRAAFMETVTIHAPAYDYARELPAVELPALVLSARAPYTELSLDFYDFSITFPSDGQADVRVTSRLRGQLYSGERVEDIQELYCRLLAFEDQWQFQSIEIVEVLDR